MANPGTLQTAAFNASVDKSVTTPIVKQAPDDSPAFDSNVPGTALPIGATNASEVDIGAALTPTKMLGARYNQQRTPVTGNSYTALPTDYLIAVNVAHACAITIPTASAALNGFELNIKDEGGNATADNITITPATGNIDGSANVVISTNYGTAHLYCNGTAWFTR